MRKEILFRASIGMLFFSACCLLSACSRIDRNLLEFQAALPDAEFAVRPSREQQFRFAELVRNTGTRPLKIAIYLYLADDGAFAWRSREQGSIMQWKNSVEDETLIDNMFVIPTTEATGNSLAELRYVAAERGANTLLVLKSGGDAHKGHNPLALFYLTLIGYFIVPGSNASAEIMVNGTVLDVGTGKELASLNATGTGFTMVPGAWLDIYGVIDSAKEDALKQLRRQFVKQMDKLPLIEAPARVRKPRTAPLPAPQKPPTQSGVISY